MAGQIKLLGRPRAYDLEGRLVDLPIGAFVIMAMIALDRREGFITRHDAGAALWEDAEPIRRAGNLRQLLQRVRRAQSEHRVSFLQETGQAIHLVGEGNSLDLHQFQALLRDRPDLQVSRLCDLYAGHLLENVRANGGVLTQWLYSRRAAVRESFVTTANAGIEAESEALDPEQAQATARRLLQADPYSEPAYRALMRIFARLNQLDLVEKVYRDLEKVLARDLDVAPAPPSAALYAELVRLRTRPGPRKETVRSEGDAGAAPVLPSPSPAFRPPSALPSLLIGIRLGNTIDPVNRDILYSVVDDLTVAFWRSRSFKLYRSTPPPRQIHGDVAQPPADYRLEMAISNQTMTAELSCPATSEVLWANNWSLASGLAQVVNRVCQFVLSNVEAAELALAVLEPEVRQTYRRTIRGNRLLHHIDLPSVRRARAHFKAALQLDADYAPALVGLSKTYRLEWLLLSRDQNDGLELATELANRAIQVDPDDPLGPHHLGLCEIYRRRFDRGLFLLEQAEQRGADGFGTLPEYADALIMSGDARGGLQRLEATLKNPGSTNDQVLWAAAGGYYFQGKYRDSIRCLSKLNTEESAFHLRAACHALLGEHDEAARFAQSLKENLPQFSIESRLKLAPIQRIEDADHYRSGLILAGFDP